MSRRASTQFHQPSFDHPEGVFQLRPDAGLQLLQSLLQPIHLAICLQHAALGRAHGNVPRHSKLPGLFARGGTLVARIPEHKLLLAVQQRRRLRHVVGAGSGANDRVNQPRFRIYANVRLPAEVPLVALLGLMHLGIACAILVPGRTRRRDERGLHHRACLEHQPLGGEQLVHARQDLIGRLVLLQQPAKAQDAAGAGEGL